MKASKFLSIAGISVILIFFFYFSAIGQETNTASYDATSVMAKCYTLTKDIRNFRITFQIISENKTFLDDIFSQTKSPAQRFPVKGELDFTLPAQMGIHLETFLGDKADLFSRNGYSWSLYKEDENIKDKTPGIDLNYHPLAFLVPFNFWMLSNVHYMGAGEDTVYDSKCYVIDVVNQEQNQIKLWISQSDYSIRKMDFADPAGSRKFTAYFKDYYHPNGGSWFCTQLEVSMEGNILYNATFNNLETNLKNISGTLNEIKPPISTTADNLTPTPPATSKALKRKRPKTAANQNTEWTSFFNPISVLLIILFLAGAGWIYLQYIQPYLLRKKFLGERIEFSKEIILFDDMESIAAKALDELGYKTVPFSNDELAESINALRSPGINKPKIMVIAANSFPDLKESLPIIKAYVLEGGRILLLPHNQKSSRGLPFTAAFHSYDSWDTAIIYNVILSIWKRISDKDVVGRHTHIIPSDVYLTVDGRKIEKEIIKAIDTAANVEGTAIGIIDEGKGKYLLCQYNLSEGIAKGLNASIAQGIFNDILDFLLN